MQKRNLDWSMMMKRLKINIYNILNQFQTILSNIGTQYLDLIKGNNLSSFTRRRKVSPKLIFLFLISYKGKSQKNELEDFYYDISKPKDVSSWGFIKQRLKFNPEVIKVINNDYLKGFYGYKGRAKTFKGYYVIAGDGSDIIVPSTEENNDLFGYQKGHKSKQPAMANVSVIYDCINKMIIYIQLNTYKYSEKKSLIKHLKISRNLLEDKKRLYILDRGYPDIRSILNFIDNKEKFIVRLKKTDFKKELNSMKSNDEWIDIIYDRARTNQFRKGYELVERLLKEKINLRFVKIPIKTSEDKEEEEILITNLESEVFTTKSLKELYHMRWEVETSYRTLKSNLKLEEFSGHKPIIITQDVYTSVFVFNLIQDIMIEADLKNKINQEKYKHKMKINNNFAIGLIKKQFIKLLFIKSKRRQNKLINDILIKISQNIVPIRNDRNYSRKVTSVNKSRMSYKYAY